MGLLEGSRPKDGTHPTKTITKGWEYILPDTFTHTHTHPCTPTDKLSLYHFITILKTRAIVNTFPSYSDIYSKRFTKIL